MKKIVLIAAVFGSLVLSGCTDNMRAKNFGGTIRIHLPPNTKLVNSTWKEDDLWYLERPMRVEETPEVYTMHENSSFGMMQGTVIFYESKN